MAESIQELYKRLIQTNEERKAEIIRITERIKQNEEEETIIRNEIAKENIKPENLAIEIEYIESQKRDELLKDEEYLNAQ